MSISTKNGDKKISRNILDNIKCDIAKNDSYFSFVGELDLLHSNLSLIKHDLSDKNVIDIFEEIIHTTIPGLYASLPLAGSYKKKFNNNSYLLKIEKYILDNEKILNLNNTFYELGQTKLSSLIDISRSIARKVEREFVNLSIEKKFDEQFYLLNFSYLNRLSDFLFIVARMSEKKQGKLKGRN